MHEVVLSLLIVMADGDRIHKEVSFPTMEECKFTENQMHKDGFIKFTNHDKIKFLRLYSECK